LFWSRWKPQPSSRTGRLGGTACLTRPSSVGPSAKSNGEPLGAWSPLSGLHRESRQATTFAERYRPRPTAALSKGQTAGRRPVRIISSLARALASGRAAQSGRLLLLAGVSRGCGRTIIAFEVERHRGGTDHQLFFWRPWRLRYKFVIGRQPYGAAGQPRTVGVWQRRCDLLLPRSELQELCPTFDHLRTWINSEITWYLYWGNPISRTGSGLVWA
jgi:hypothetical protein